MTQANFVPQNLIQDPYASIKNHVDITIQDQDNHKLLSDGIDKLTRDKALMVARLLEDLSNKPGGVILTYLEDLILGEELV